MAGHCGTLEERQTTGQGRIGILRRRCQCFGAEGASYFGNAFEDNAVHLQRPAKVLEAVQTLFDHVKARRVTEPNGAIVAKGSTRHDGDIGFAQQTVGEILGA